MVLSTWGARFIYSCADTWAMRSFSPTLGVRFEVLNIHFTGKRSIPREPQ